MKNKDYPILRNSGLWYFGPGEFFAGKEITTPTFAVYFTQPLEHYFQSAISEQKRHPFDDEVKFNHNDFSFGAHLTKAGFNRCCDFRYPEGSKEPFVLLFSPPCFNPESERELDDARAKAVAMFQTMVFIMKVANSYVMRQIENKKASVSETQQLLFSFEENSFNFTCHLGINLHCFLSNKKKAKEKDQEMVFGNAEAAMRKVLDYLHPNLPFTQPPSAVVLDEHGALLLTVPGFRSAQVRVSPNSSGEVKNQNSGYSLISERVDTFPQLFALLAGLLTIYKQFQTSYQGIRF